MPPARGLILDRDGVINVDIGYLHRAEDCVFVDGIFALLRDFQARGFRLIVATNQAGIARGLYGEAEFQALTRWMDGKMRAEGVVLDAVYHCPFHPTEGIGAWRRASDRRKPAPGMFLEAIADFGLDPAASWALGDREHDMTAAAAAGIGHRVLLDRQATTAVPRSDGVRVVPTLAAVGHLLAAADEAAGALPKNSPGP